MHAPLSTLVHRLEAEAPSLGINADAVARIAAYGAELLRIGARTNLIGTLDPERVADELLIDSLRALPLMERSGRLVDVGSGAGLPGVPLLLARPEWSGVLIEPRRKRAAFLRHLLRTFPLEGEVVEARLEDWLAGEHGAGVGFDVAVSRAVFAPARWVEVAAPLLAPEGLVLVWANEPPSLPEDFPAGWQMRGRNRYLLERGAPRVVFALAPPNPVPAHKEPH